MFADFFLYFGEGVEPLCRGGQTELMIKVADRVALTFLQLGWSLSQSRVINIKKTTKVF